GGVYSIAWTDITTGEFYVETLKSGGGLDLLCDYLVRCNPAQIICSQNVYLSLKDTVVIKHGVLPKPEIYKEWAFSPLHAETTVKSHFNVLTLNAFGINENYSAISACGALIEYLRETQKHSLINITTIKLVEPSDYMILDAIAVKNLELVKSQRDGKRYGTLLGVLDETNTSMGSRNLYNWVLNPLQDENKINYRLSAVEEVYKDNLLRNALVEVLSNVRDTERLSGKVSNGNINPKDAYNLSKSLELMPSIKSLVSNSSCKALCDVDNAIADFSEITNLVKFALKDDISVNALKDGDFVKDGFDRELDRLREVAKNSGNLLKELEERERNSTGIKTLRVGYNRVFGYYIEVSNSFKDKVPYSYVRKQTLVNGERFITEELKNLEEDILTSKEKSLKIELEIFAKIKAILSENIVEIQKASKAVAFIDVITSLAIVAKKYNYCKPVIAKKGKPLTIVDGRHPVVESVSSSQFIPNDTTLCSKGDRMMIITGPNMAGKSTYMRQVALITLMAHIGSFTPCKSCSIPITDKIFTRVGASDNLVFDQSTFMVEMNEVASILNKATENSLIILDEIGRGTSTYDGLSIAWAVVEFVAEKIKANTLFATHYHELSELEGRLEGVKNYKVTVKEHDGSIVFLRKIQEGSANKSFGIEVASLAGVPKAVTNRAKVILKNLEKNDLNAKNDGVVESISYEREESVVENMLKSVDLNTLSPLEAINLLYKMKKELED
ncbi:MAG: DNA mismatch repair protein MutS, partial [Clostridia bacterium]|nr:DNA mismatch repair protein MutS [Clostridia bacterium]